jgi:hypothetical protein
LGEADGAGDSVGGVDGWVSEAWRGDVTADGDGLGNDGGCTGAAGGTGRDAEDCAEDGRGEPGKGGDVDGTNGSGTNNDGGLGSRRPSFGIGRRAGATAICSTDPRRGGADEAPSVTQPISATSNACPTSKATAVRTVRRTVRVTGTGSTRRTLWHPIDGSEVSGP